MSTTQLLENSIPEIPNEEDMPFEFDASLLEQIESLEGASQSESKSKDEPEEDSTLFEGDEHESFAEMLIDGFEVLVKTVGHERYEIAAGKKLVLVGAYAKLLKKHEGKCPEWLLSWKEELICVGVTLFVMFVTYKSVTELKKQDVTAKREEKKEKAKGGDDGEKSERSSKE